MSTAAPSIDAPPFTEEDLDLFTRMLDDGAAPICEAAGVEEPDRCHREAVARAMLVPCGCGWLSCAECREEADEAIASAPRRGGILVLKCSNHRIAVTLRWVEL